MAPIFVIVLKCFSRHSISNLSITNEYIGHWFAAAATVASIELPLSGELEGDLLLIVAVLTLLQKTTDMHNLFRIQKLIKKFSFFRNCLKKFKPNFSEFFQ
jgi:hypothetical protein